MKATVLGWLAGGCIIGFLIGTCGSNYQQITQAPAAKPAQTVNPSERLRPALPSEDDDSDWPIWWNQSHCVWLFNFNYEAAWYCDFDGYPFVYSFSPRNGAVVTFAPKNTITSTVNMVRRSESSLRLRYGK